MVESDITSSNYVGYEIGNPNLATGIERKTKRIDSDLKAYGNQANNNKFPSLSLHDTESSHIWCSNTGQYKLL